MAKIFYRELKNKILSKKFDKCYFLFGEEESLILQIEDLVINSKLGKNKNEFNFMKINANQLDIDSIGVYLNTYPIQFKNKCMVIRNLDVDLLEKEQISEFLDIVKDIPDFSTLIISQTSISKEALKLPKWKSFIYSITSLASVAEFKYKDNLDLENQLIFYAEEKGKTISKKNAQLLIRRCGRDFGSLKMEIDKLCAFEQSNSITEKSIEAITLQLVDYNVFSLCNSLFASDYADVFKRLENLFHSNESPILILSAIASNYIDVFRVKTALEEGCAYTDLPDYFDYKNKEFKLDIANRHAVKMSMPQIKESIKCLLYSDKDLKNSNIPPEIIIYFLIFKLIEIKEGKNEFA